MQSQPPAWSSSGRAGGVFVRGHLFPDRVDGELVGHLPCLARRAGVGLVLAADVFGEAGHGELPASFAGGFDEAFVD